MFSTRRRARKLRSRTDLAASPPTETRRRGRSALTGPFVPVVSMDEVDRWGAGASEAAVRIVSRTLRRARRSSEADGSSGTRFFNEQTEAAWILRGAGCDRRVVQLAVEGAADTDERQGEEEEKEEHNVEDKKASELGPSKPEEPVRSVSSEVTALLQPRRKGPRTPSAPMDSRHREGRSKIESRKPPLHGKDRRVQFKRGRRRDGPLSDEPRHDANPASSSENDKHSWYDPDVDHHWRLPIGKPLRRADLVSNLPEKYNERDPATRWSTGTASEADIRVRGNVFQADRSDRRGMPTAWRDDGPVVRPRDRSGKRIGNSGARWRGLMARKDLVDGKADAFCVDTADKSHDLSPRSSLDIEEATSLYSWDEPPSTSVRGWRSNHSLSYRPQPDRRPRNIRAIGRQRCINDLTNIVDASNEPCVSYDRQIFDPVSKLWTYVEACQPSSSPWELRAVGSPVTCSVSGTEEAVSTGGRGATPTPASAANSLVVNAPSPTPPVPPKQSTQRRNSSPAFAAITSAREAKRAFMATRDLWLGTTRKSVYGPANLEAVIFASEMDDVEEGILRRASMA